ncbi:MAG: helix-turn-helix domain-containing protein [Muribaculaceae bacterium]|nr:helix-turn-helix domain-containing protein [Muribaculaceae bacterium]
MSKRSLAAVVLVAFAFLTQAAEYLWRNISLDAGLSHSNVTAITRDNRGFIWIGTRFGLNRYDFENVVNFYHDPDNAKTIPDNSIRALFTDSRGNIWVAGESGVAVSRDGRTFERITIDGTPINARSFHEEGDGLLMGSAGVIYYYDYNSGAIAPLQTRGGSSYFYTDIISRGNNFYVLVTRWDGLWLFDRTRASISRLAGVDSKNIMSACIDSRGTLWMSPYGQGVKAYDRAGSQIFDFTSSSSELPSDIVLDIAEYDNNIWFATDGGGVAIFHPDTETLERSPARTNSGQIASVTTLYTDDHNNLFAGTVRDGAASVLPVAMHTFHSSRHSLSAITSAWIDEADDIIWLGDDGNGVIRYNLDDETLTPVATTSGLKVIDLVGHDNATLLVTTFDKGFFLMDKKTGKITPAPADLERLRQRIGNQALGIHTRRLADNVIALVSDRISLYDPATRTITGESEQPQGLTGSLLPFFNRDGRLLCYGTNYVTEYDPVTDAHSCLFRLPRGERINCAVFDGAHTIFVATDRGIKAFDTVSGEMSAMSDINERVSALACDGDARLYIATTRAIYLKDRTTGNIVGFDVNDGVTPNEYLPNATLFHDNCLLFGGIYGLLRIHPDEVDDLLSVQNDPAINLAEIKIDGIDSGASITDGALTVPAKHSFVTLSVIDNGTNSHHRHKFRYYISHPGETKMIETFARTVDLNFLESGKKYDISVSAMRPDGSWIDPPYHLVTVDVMSLWWMSPFLWLAVGLLLVAVLGGLWIRVYHRRKARLAARLDTYRRNTLEKELSFFVNTNYALRTPLTLIYAPVKLLIEQLHDGKEVEIVPALEMIYRNTKKMRDSIDMALQLHRVTDIKDDSQLSTHDINRSVSEVIATLKHELDIKHISCRHTRSQEMFPALYDRDRLRAVIETLIRNAIERSSDNAVIEIRTELHGNFIRVSVSDSGEHLDNDTLEGLFSKYFHDDNSKFGNSLGFAYVRNIIDMMDGNTGVENNAGDTGITVWFEFPAAPSHDVEKYISRRRSELEIPKTGGEAIVADVDTSALTAVVVEADNDLAIFIADQLSVHFGKVLHAFNGKDALMLVRQYQPDIVISSLMLPVMSGLDLCQTLKKSPETSHIPVILLTALKDDPQIADAYGAGADSYISKPFDLNVLLTRCRNILHSRSVIKQRYSSQHAPATGAKQLSNVDESFLLKVNKIIAENLSNPAFSVETIVEMMAFSRSALYAKFKEVTGQSIGSYISDYRLRRAKELLRDNTLSISDISEALGFSSQRYFSTFFRERTGMSPSAFRNNPNLSVDNE